MSLLRFARLQVLSTAIFVFLLACAGARGEGAPWLPYGPDGGDARSFAVDTADHAHLYLGTANGWIYESHDEGAAWSRLSKVGKRDDLVIDNIVVDSGNPKHLMIGAWVLGSDPDGGFFESRDGGRSWTSPAAMVHQSIRALAQAPSDPKVLVAGTLTGVYRSRDAGEHWDLISPPESKEIHEVESIAIDPVDPETIYAGTWHLPWKTVDGGQNWSNITARQGIIDDSDVFSIIIDPKDPKTVYASACSGIYKSEDAGVKFEKVKGIPNTARRTQVLMQDPENLDVVYAGTTEGLFRTQDAGHTWGRLTGPEVIVNDVFVDPKDSQRVMLATARGGVLMSNDGGMTFEPSNRGFSARQITAFVGDARRPGTLYAGVVNDKEWGGVFMSRDGGLTWAQRSDGLSGRDVFSLAEAPDGSLVAGTGHGIFRYEDGIWLRTMDAGILAPSEVRVEAAAADDTSARLVRASAETTKGKVKTGTTAKARAAAARAHSSGRSVVLVKGTTRTVPKSHAAAGKGVVGGSAVAGSGYDGVVHALASVGDRMFAATSEGVLSGDATGGKWAKVPGLDGSEWWYVAAAKQSVVVAGLSRMMYSSDGGRTWLELSVPPKVTQVSAVAVDDKGEFWVGGREGVFLSSDNGLTWQTLRDLYMPNVDSLYYDARTDQILVTSNGGATLAGAVNVETRAVKFWDTGWNLRFMRPVGDHLLGATLYDGVVIEPRWVEVDGKGGA
jgi:photosystem II stability/assembly factor-like uncharacterized protein